MVYKYINRDNPSDGAFGLMNSLKTPAPDPKILKASENLQKEFAKVNINLTELLSLTKVGQTTEAKNEKSLANIVSNESKETNSILTKLYNLTKDESYEASLRTLNLTNELKDGFRKTQRSGKSETGVGLGLPLGGIRKPKGKGLLGKLFGRFAGGTAAAAEGAGAEAVGEGAAAAGAGAIATPALIAAAVGAAIVGGIEIFTHWKQTKAFAKLAAGDIAKFGGQIADIAGKTLETVVAALPGLEKTAGELIHKAVDQIKGDGGKEAKEDAARLISSVSKAIGGVTATISDWLAKEFSPENLKKMLDEALAAAKAAAAAAAAAAAGAAGNAAIGALGNPLAAAASFAGKLVYDKNSSITASKQLSLEDRALADTVAAKESPKAGYRGVYGNLFTIDNNQNPFEDPKQAAIFRAMLKAKGFKHWNTTAAGRYQFERSTWLAEKKKLGLKDFSAESQDLAFIDLAKTAYHAKTHRNLENDLKSKDPNVRARIGSALASTWASLPGGEQSTVGKAEFLAKLGFNLGKEAQATATADAIEVGKAKEAKLAADKAAADKSPPKPTKAPSSGPGLPTVDSIPHSDDALGMIYNSAMLE